MVADNVAPPEAHRRRGDGSWRRPARRRRRPSMPAPPSRRPRRRLGADRRSGRWARQPAAHRAAERSRWAWLFDAEHLRRVLVNLLDNALRHASAAARRDRSLRLAARDDAMARCCRCSATAPPIAAEVERHLFEPFFSTRSRGSGLGLYICRELCERYGASIDYRPRPAAERLRNEFIVTMRRATLSDAPTPCLPLNRMIAPRYRAPPAGRRRRARPAHAVRTDAGARGLRRRQRRHGRRGLADPGRRARYDLLITDMRLPDGTGLDLLAATGGGRPPREGDRHHRLRLGGERGRGAEGRRLRLPDQAGRPAPVPRRRGFGAGPRAADAGRGAARRHRAPAGAPDAAGAALALARLAGDSTAMPQVRALVQQGGAQHGAGAGAGRVGHRQGTGRARDPRGVAARRAALRRGELRRHPRAVARGRVLRLSQGRLHRRAGGPRRLLPGRAGRHAVPRRDRRPAAGRCRASCCASIQERAVRPIGAVTEMPVERAHPQRHAQGPGRARCTTAASGRTCTTA